MSKVEIDRNHFEILKKKASVLEELLELLEDKYFGDLMEESEKDETISLSEAEKLLK